MARYRPDEPHKDLWDQLRRKDDSVTYATSPEQSQYMSDTLRARFAEVIHPRTGAQDSVSTRAQRRENCPATEIKGYCLLCGGSLFTDESVKRGMGLKCLKQGLALGIVVRKPDGTFSLKGRHKRT